MNEGFSPHIIWGFIGGILGYAIIMAASQGWDAIKRAWKRLFPTPPHPAEETLEEIRQHGLRGVKAVLLPKQEWYQVIEYLHSRHRMVLSDGESGFRVHGVSVIRKDSP